MLCTRNNSERMFSDFKFNSFVSKDCFKKRVRKLSQLYNKRIMMGKRANGIS